MRPLPDAVWTRIRATTPAADAFLHLNHASSSLPDAAVFQAQREFLELEARLGTHRAVERVEGRLETVATAIAQLIDALPHQVVLAQSASRAWALALSAVPRSRPIHVFFGKDEWAANLMNLTRQAFVAKTTLVDGAAEGWAAAMYQALQALDPGCAPLVSLPLVSSFNGEVQDLRGVAQVVHDQGGWLFVDACQAAGQMPVSMCSLGADVLVFPGRKWLRGPRGTAVLVLSDRALDAFDAPVLLDIHGSHVAHADSPRMSVLSGAGADRFQAYEYHPALRLGLLAAVQQLIEISPRQVTTQVNKLASKLRDGLQQQLGAQVLGSGGSGLVCFRLAGVNHEDLVRAMWQRGVNIATIGQRYAPHAFSGCQSRSVIRASPHVTNTEQEIEQALDLIGKEYAGQRKANT